MRQRYYVLVVFIIILAGCATRKQSTLIPPPPKQVVVNDTVHKNNVEVVAKKDTVKTDIVIGLVLPLHLLAHFESDSASDITPLLMPEIIPALQFYEGALAAKDSLAKLPVNIKFRIFDCSGDSSENVRLLNNYDLRKCDAVILMTGSNLNSSVAKAAAKSFSPFIILQNSNTQILETNSNIWLANPGNSTQIKLMASYLYNTYPSSQFVTIFRETRNESELAKLFSSVIDSLSGTTNTCQKVNYDKGSIWSSLQNKFSKQKRNILIIPTSDESYVSSIVSKLDDIKNEYSFLLAGLPTWQNFETIDPMTLQNYNTHFFTGLYIDPDNQRNHNFRKSFMDAYHTDALDQAFEAFDLVNYLVNNINSNQKKYNIYKGLPDFESPSHGFDFMQVCPDCGRENQSISILKFSDYKLIKVK